jgi:methionyl aminopeptidase
MREANRVVGKVLARMAELVGPGVTTAELDAEAEALCRQMGAKPAFKGYRGFPFALCASPNQQVVHGFPNRKPLVEGDILSLDFGTVLDGFYGDAAVTLPVGKVSGRARRLMEVTQQALMAGIEQMRPGNRLGQVSAAVQDVVEKGGFSVVRQFVGHGIGRALHEEPQLPNYGHPGQGVRLKAGMVIAIEPMVNAGEYEVTILDDGWTAVTVDGKISAHFEHSVAITVDGPQILSLP